MGSKPVLITLCYKPCKRAIWLISYLIKLIMTGHRCRTKNTSTQNPKHVSLICKTRLAKRCMGCILDFKMKQTNQFLIKWAWPFSFKLIFVFVFYRNFNRSYSSSPRHQLYDITLFVGKQILAWISLLGYTFSCVWSSKPICTVQTGNCKTFSNRL